MISEIDVDQLPVDIPTKNHRAFKWSGDGEVYFTLTKHGNAASIHIGATRENRANLEQAVNDFCKSVFMVYDWCKVIVGIVGKRSVVNLGKKCGFSVLGKKKTPIDGKMTEVTIIARFR